MNNRFKKIIPILIILASLAMSSFFFVSKKASSSESQVLAVKNDQVPIKTVIADEAVSQVRILFVGDMMFDRYIRKVSDRNGYDFSFRKVDALLKGNDLVVGNLEGPITDNKSVSIDSEMGESNNYIFTFDPKIAEVLSNKNIKLVNIGNNHIANFASSGIENTRKYLTKSGVVFFGDPEDADKRLAIKNIKNTKVAFINYNQFIFGAEQKTIADINNAKSLNADFIVLYTHWGKEFMTEPEDKMKILAHKFIDNGVDLIIGSHPHVVQPKEEYKGKLIYYSLGNFIFDQYFDPNTQKGLAVQVIMDLNDKKIFTKDFPIIMNNKGQTLQN